MKSSSACLFGDREHGVKRAFFEITNRCNMSCKHCMNNSGDNSQQDLPKEKIIKLFKELYNHQIMHLYISGGEPLLYNDIDEVLQYAHTLGIKIILATNGLEITKHLTTIKRCVDTVSVSLDGIGETHDIFRGVPGSFDYLISMLDILKNEGITTKMSTIIWRKNLNQLTDIISIAKEKGISKLNFNILVHEGRAKANPDIHIPSEEYPHLYEKVSELIEKYSDHSFEIDLKRRHQLNTNSIACPGGNSIFHINSKGRVSPCSWISKLDDNNEFSLMWENGNLGNCIEVCGNINAILDERKSLYGYSGCPALANIHNGSYISEDPLNEYLKFV